ncbi:MAG: protein kinase [Gemmatimonadota bacterium]
MSLDPRLSTALSDRYRIERELGAGGMATVYLAEDLKHDRKVAIKVLRPELAAVIGAERFLREIKTIAALQHPHVLGLIDSGTVTVGSLELGVGAIPPNSQLPTPHQGPGSYVYYVMPFVDGESLRGRLTRETQLPVAEAIRIATEIAGALDYAHRHGVIHRDIKPENILLHDGSVLVADFGIALSSSPDHGPRMTETGMSLGTPQYMSPEQAMGERSVDARSDIFALGCVLYEMLLGEPPFTGVTAQAIIARVMTTDAPSLTAQRRTIPPAVDQAVHKALERLPADRFDTAAAFAAALHDASAAPRTASRPHWGWWLWIPAGLVVVALTVVGVIALRHRNQSNTATDNNLRVVAVLPFRNISQDTGQRYFSAGMTEEITNQLARVAALRVLGRAATAQYDTAGNKLERMSKELGVGSVVDGSVSLAGDQVRIRVELTDVKSGQSLWSEQYDRKLADLFAVQDDVAHKVTEALQATLTSAEARRAARAPTSNMAAYQLYLRALDLHGPIRSENLAQAELLKQAIALDPRFAGAYANLARTYMFRSVAGEPAYTDSGFIAARKAVALDPELDDAHFALGDLQNSIQRFSDARRSYLKALELNPSHGGAMADLANTYVALGRYDESLDWALRNSMLNPTNIHVPYHTGLPLIQLDDDSATARYLQAAERLRPTELRVQGLLAWLELRRGEKVASLARARKLVADNPGNTEGPPILAEQALLTGAPDAEQLLKPLVAADPKAPSQYDAAGLRACYALALYQRGDDKTARTLWDQSAAEAEAQLKAGAEGPAAPMELAAINAIEGNTKVAMDWLEKGYHAGWKDARQLELDPFFASVRQDPRYKAVTASMRQDVTEMRKRAAAAHPEIFGGTGQ